MRIRSILLALLLAAAAVSCKRGEAAVQEEESAPPIPPIGFRADDFSCEESTVRGGATCAALMNRLGLDKEEAYT